MKRGSLLMSGLMAASLAMSSSAVAADAQAKPAAPEQTVKKMQANAKKLQTQLDRLGKTKNEAEFQKLLAEHMQTMHENMAMAEGMAGMDCGMMGGHDMHGMMGGAGSNTATDHESMIQRMQQLEQRMGILEQAPKAAPAK